MPKGPKYACATCGKWERISLKEHHKKVHQKECTVQFKGEPGRVTCQREPDGLWRCPRCGMEFEGTPRKLQTHGLKGECITGPGDVQMPVPLEQPAPQPEQDDNKRQQPTVTVAKEEPEVEDDEEAPAGDTIVSPDDILGNYINELDDEAAFMKHLLEEDARDTQDVEIKLDTDLAPSWERELLQPGTSAATKSEDQYGASNNSCVAFPPERRLSVKEEDEQGHFFSDNTDIFRPAPNLASVNRPSQMHDVLHTDTKPSRRPVPNVSHQGHSITRSAEAGANLYRTHAASSSSHIPSIPCASHAHATGVADYHHLPDPSIPPALRSFLATLRIPSEHLAPIFTKQHMTTDDALDLLCEAPLCELVELKAEILREGGLAGWLAVHKGLEQRALGMRMG